MKTQFSTIDPTVNGISEFAVIQKVNSPQEQLPNDEHGKAVHAFLIADAIASGISNDLSFVDKIPQFIDEIIDNKSWECLYVSKAVAQPYYCRINQGTDSENFRAFITAKRPNGLGTSVETLDRVLQAEIEVRNKFRAIIYQSIEQERDELGKYKKHPLGSDFLTDEITDRQQRNIRAANRAAEAIPDIRELLDRGLINIDIAAKLGRQIKDPDNLSAEEREYVDKRDLVGLRIKEYINTNTIPEDEDREPAYRRQLNEFVKDLLGIKNRSKAVRMDHPKKAAEKLLQFYQGENLKQLLQYLREGFDSKTMATSSISQDDLPKDSEHSVVTETSNKTNAQIDGEERSGSPTMLNRRVEQESLSRAKKQDKSDISVSSTQINKDRENSQSSEKKIDLSKEKKVDSHKSLNTLELAERLKVSRSSINYNVNKSAKEFKEWTIKKDPDGLAWQKNIEKEGRINMFSPIEETDQ
ncbi:MAG: hypothetical protein AAFQ80_24255 [Cyanobacteria bacterium J06621_8]